MGAVRYRALAAVWSVACLAAVACGAVPAQAQTLALAYRGGDTYLYSVHTVSNDSIGGPGGGTPFKFDITAHETVTVKAVDSSGTADLTVALSNIAMKSATGGVTNTTTGITLPIVEMKIGADGRIVSVDGIAAMGSFMPSSGTGQAFISAVLPDTPVKPGDTWSKNYDQANPIGSGTIRVTTDSRYLRDETFNGVKAAVVETKSSTVIDVSIDLSKLTSGTVTPISGAEAAVNGIKRITVKGTATSDVTTWIDPSGHRVMKTHETSKSAGTINMAVTPGAASPTTLPMMGPMSTSGTVTFDLTPA